jgi:hypothetical protein
MKFIGAAALATRQRRERRHGPLDRNETLSAFKRRGDTPLPIIIVALSNFDPSRATSFVASWR